MLEKRTGCWMDLCLTLMYVGTLSRVAARAAFPNSRVPPVPLELDRLYWAPLRADQQGEEESSSFSNSTWRQRQDTRSFSSAVGNKHCEVGLGFLRSTLGMRCSCIPGWRCWQPPRWGKRCCCGDSALVNTWGGGSEGGRRASLRRLLCRYRLKNQTWTVS